ncbi:MAG: trimethylamine methyltransferase family protein [Deltaproteobacteria bacterium]|nr:trimethylamine methyltransferase family protein [Deltaproteobacteria bacterium]
MPLSLTPVLTHSEIQQIHERSLDLLERVGIDYQTPRALEVLERHGCPVDYERNWASLPRDFVEWAIEQAPRVVRLEARDPSKSVVLDGRRAHHSCDSQGSRAIDFETGECVPSTEESLRRGILFADALDKLDIVSVMVAATDIPAHLRVLRHFQIAFELTGKPVRTGVLHAEQVPFLVELARAATGEDEFRPIFSTVHCSISPLKHDGAATAACMELAKLRVPILLHPMPLAGATSPLPPAGTILQHNVEVLSGLALFQAVQPGAPLVYAAGPAQLDMVSGNYADSANANAMRLALVDIARFYNLPVNLGGLGTASPRLDAQYGYEASSACLLAYLAGVDEIFSTGLLDSSQTLSLDKLVLDNHLTRELEIMVQPIQIDEEHLSADLIEQVGIGQHYLKRPETLASLREEYVRVWPPVGRDILELARDEAREILKNHRPPALPDGALERMQEIVNEADRVLATAKD